MTTLFRFFIFIFVATLLFSPKQGYAHGTGMAPYVKINNVFVLSNPISILKSTEHFIIPQDIAPANYLINQELTFTIDNKQLTTFLPSDMLDHTTFTWDFGDGTRTKDTNTKHTYTQMGSYVVLLTIHVAEKNNPTPITYTDSYLLHIVPTLDTKLPQAIIQINDNQPKDPLADEMKIDFSKKATFDGSHSQKASSEIIEYLWDFGDGATSQETRTTHTYTKQYLQTPVLRIKDKNGFLSYAAIQLINTQTLHRTTPKSQLSTQQLAVSIALVLILITVILIAISKRRNK